MDRREKLDWIKAEVCPKLDLSQELDIPCILSVITKFRKEHHWKIDEPMHAEVNEYGHLIINGIHAGQITNKIPHAYYQRENCGDYEAAIIARQEAYGYYD